MSADFHETYEQWKLCLQRNLGKDWNKEFLQKRIDVLSNHANSETKKFLQVYGKARAEQVLQWFKKALEEDFAS